MLPFLTDYDPIGGSSGSIDPLGALRSYMALADLLLPGVTTITTRSRYLSMMCAALANAEKHREFLPGASGLAQRRKAVEPFERLWALACVAAGKAGQDGAADGLRGVSYAENSYQFFAAGTKKASCDFPLLKYQSRTGAVGTYWGALASGQLIDPNTGALAPDGQELAAVFPDLPFENKSRANFASPDTALRVTLTLDEVAEWGMRCHLRAASPDERKKLGEVLTADVRREYVSQALGKMAEEIPGDWGIADLRRLQQELDAIPPACKIGLPVVVEGVIRMELFHDAVLAVFETLLWWGTQHSAKPINDLVADGDFRKSYDRCIEAAQNFREFFHECDRRNAAEAEYIARLIRALLVRQTGLSIGVMAFSEAQQSEIDGAPSRLADEDNAFRGLLDGELGQERVDVGLRRAVTRITRRRLIRRSTASF
jgi:hypothetical protein